MGISESSYGDWEIGIVSPTIQQSVKDSQQDKEIKKNSDDNIAQQAEIDRNTSINDLQEQQIIDLYNIVGQGPASGTTIVYILDTNFKVEADSGVTSYNISYEAKHNNEPVEPKSCIITKYVNDGSGIVILNNTGVSGTTITSTVTGNREKYVLDVIPGSHTVFETKSEITRYIYYVGSSSVTSMSGESVELLNKYVSNGDKLKVKESTGDEQYLWFVIPDSLNLEGITTDSVSFVLDDVVQTITNSLGSFKCYRSKKLLVAANWNLMIYTSEV